MTKSRRLVLVFAKRSIIFLTSNSISLCTCNKHNPVNRASVILERSHVFNLLNVEKERSAEATLTGKVASICNSLFIVGKNSSSQQFTSSITFSGISSLFFHLVVQSCNSPLNWFNNIFLSMSNTGENCSRAFSS